MFFAVIVRRLHDKNMSGLWILANLIPIIGNIVFLVVLVILMFGDGTIWTNPGGTAIRPSLSKSNRVK